MAGQKVLVTGGAVKTRPHACLTLAAVGLAPALDHCDLRSGRDVSVRAVPLNNGPQRGGDAWRWYQTGGYGGNG